MCKSVIFIYKFIPRFRSKEGYFLDFAFSGHVFHVDKMRYTNFKNRIHQENHVGHVETCLHMKGLRYY